MRRQRMTLFEINEAIANFEFEIDEESGEILNINVLDDLELDRNVKIENIACYVKNLRADSAAIIEEARKMKDRADVLDRKADRLEDYLAHNLNGEKFETPKCQITWRKSSRVDVANDALVPDRFCAIRTVRTPNKTIIKKAIKNGETVNGCSLIETNNIHIG